MNQPDAAKETRREALVNPEIPVSEHGEAILAKVIQVIAALERDPRRSPRLLDAEGRVQRVTEADFPDSIENRGITIAKGCGSDFVPEREQSPGRLRIRDDIVFNRRGEPQGEVLIEVGGR